MTLRAYTGDDTLRMNHVRSRGGCYVLAGREGDDVYLAIRREDLPQGVFDELKAALDSARYAREINALSIST